MMEPLQLTNLGFLNVGNPEPGQPPFLSAASGVVLSADRLYVVGDDQAALAEYTIDTKKLERQLRGEGSFRLDLGVAHRIIPDVLPVDPGERRTAKADFEALTVVTYNDMRRIPNFGVRKECQRRFPDGLVLVAGSGGVNWNGVRRSIGVVHLLDHRGHTVGLPTKISFGGLHEFMAKHTVTGELNIEGICVQGKQLVLAQRGNCILPDGTPAPNMIIRLSLGEVLRSLYTDLQIGRCELEEVRTYDLGYLPLSDGQKLYDVKLDFTDIDSISGDPYGRLIFTAAAEGVEGPIKGQIAGSVVGVIGADGNIQQMVRIADPTIKLEGVNAWWDENSIHLLLVSDADDPKVAAPLLAATLAA